MDANVRKANRARVKRTMKNLEKNNFKAAYVDTAEEALKLIKAIVPEGAKTASGGSVTLEDTGIMDYLKECTSYSKDYLDAFTSDFYLASANAITEHGEIYQVDGRSNRIAAILFGPKNVILVSGINKLVPTLKDAIVRVKNLATPPNCIRLCKDTPCAKSGTCVSTECNENHLFALGCDSEDRICCNALMMAKQREKDRIIVIIIGEDYGY